MLPCPPSRWVVQCKSTIRLTCHYNELDAAAIFSYSDQLRFRLYNITYLPPIQPTSRLSRGLREATLLASVLSPIVSQIASTVNKISGIPMLKLHSKQSYVPSKSCCAATSVLRRPKRSRVGIRIILGRTQNQGQGKLVMTLFLCP